MTPRMKSYGTFPALLQTASAAQSVHTANGLGGRGGGFLEAWFRCAEADATAV